MNGLSMENTHGFEEKIQPKSLSPSVDTTAGTAFALTGTPVLLVSDWFLNGSTVGQALSASNITSTWEYAVDLADLTVSRPFYQGANLSLTPFAGIRGASIRQSMRVKLTEASGLFSTPTPQPIFSRNHSHSWGIGPRFGGNASYLLPQGFRFEGDLAGSLLYTRYTKVGHSEDPASTTFNTGPYVASLSDYGCVRAMAEAGLGLGWGCYLNCHKYHIDFLASYDFTYMWNQNMMRKLLDDILEGTGPSSADLYFHGLTVAGRFDF